MDELRRTRFLVPPLIFVAVVVSAAVMDMDRTCGLVVKFKNYAVMAWAKANGDNRELLHNQLGAISAEKKGEEGKLDPTKVAIAVLGTITAGGIVVLVVGYLISQTMLPLAWLVSCVARRCSWCRGWDWKTAAPDTRTCRDRLYAALGAETAQVDHPKKTPMFFVSLAHIYGVLNGGLRDWYARHWAYYTLGLNVCCSILWGLLFVLSSGLWPRWFWPGCIWSIAVLGLAAVILGNAIVTFNELRRMSEFVAFCTKVTGPGKGETAPEKE